MKTPETTPSGSLRSPAPPTGEPDRAEAQSAARSAGPRPEGAPGEAGWGSQHSSEGTEGASPWAEEDAALKAALPRLRLPPKRQGPIKAPKRREGPILPDLEGKRFRCPYCGKVSAWPPPELKCPACGKTLRPPPGYGPKDREKRRIAKEQIADARDKALREMGRRAGAREPGARTGVLLVALFMLAVGIAVISASTRSAERARGGLDKRAWTTNAMDTLCMAVEHFKADVGRYPTHQEGGLRALVNVVGAPDWCGPYIKGRPLRPSRAVPHAPGLRPARRVPPPQPAQILGRHPAPPARGARAGRACAGAGRPVNPRGPRFRFPFGTKCARMDATLRGRPPGRPHGGDRFRRNG